MSASARELDAALEEVGEDLGLDLTLEQRATLLGFIDLLQRWNAAYNLTAVRDPAQMVGQHLADCLAMVGPLRRHLAGMPAARRLLDVGSGAGLPGAVIAVMQPDLAVVCVDAVGKKAAFIRQVAAELRLKNLMAEHARVERLDLAPFDVITSRAFASLSEFVDLSHRSLSSGGVFVAMKGKTPVLEIEALAERWRVFHVEHLQVPQLAAERCLIWIAEKQGVDAPDRGAPAA